MCTMVPTKRKVGSVVESVMKITLGCSLWGRKSSILHKIMTVKSRLELAKYIHTCQTLGQNCNKVREETKQGGVLNCLLCEVSFSTPAILARFSTVILQEPSDRTPYFNFAITGPSAFSLAKIQL